MTPPDSTPSWRHHLALYGPPGAGKSSLIRAAAARQFPALDLEQGGDTFEQRRKSLARLVGDKARPTLFGAADLRPENLPAGTHLILLVPSPEELVRRVRERDDRRVHKWVEHALQVRKEHLAMADQGAFQLVLQEDGPVSQVLNIIVGMFAAKPR